MCLLPSLWRPLALGGFALVFGVEIGFKLASNQVTGYTAESVTHGSRESSQQA